MMYGTITKWGNSQGIRIPKGALVAARLQENDDVEIIADKETITLRNWIWLAVNTGQPIPGCITVEAIRCVLRERGEDGSGYHNT